MVISRSFITSIRSEEDLRNNPSELIDRFDLFVIVYQLIYRFKILEFFSIIIIEILSTRKLITLMMDPWN